VSLKPPPHAAYLVAPEVREAIGMVLRRRGVPAVDSEDLTQDVIERALRTARPPESQGECVLLVRKIAKDLAIDTFKSARARGKYNAGPYENPDEAPARAPSAGEQRDPIDAARQLDVVEEQIRVGNITARQASILASSALDMPHAEIASELKLAPQTVRNELGAARRTVRQSWAAYVATALFATIALWFWVSRQPKVAAPHIEPTAPTPSSSAPPASSSPLGVAQEQRRGALHACDEKRWQPCLDGLDQAARLDPAGDAALAVQKARAEARSHLGDPQGQHEGPR
jgi:DNA-directed RNA polymerase specialized sigma24 family protein